MFFLKLLKITLPLATVTTATIATTLLVSSTKEDIESKNKDSSLVLTSLEKEVEEFKHREIFYSDKGDAKGAVELSAEDTEKLKELMKQGVDVSKHGNNLDEIQKHLEQKPNQHSDVQELGGEPSKEAENPLSHSQTSYQDAEEQEISGVEDQTITLPAVASSTEADSLAKGGKTTEQELQGQTKGLEEEKSSKVLSEETHKTEEVGPVQSEEEAIESHTDTEVDEEVPMEEDSLNGKGDNELMQQSNRQETGTVEEREGDLQRDSTGPDGNSIETKVDLVQLKELENRLNTSKEALGAILQMFPLS